MELTPELARRFDSAVQNQSAYQPSEAVRKIISDKTLVMVVAPAAMGKSYVIAHAIQADNDIAQTISFSTRDPRPGDEGNMRTIPRDDAHISVLLDLIETRQLINYTIFPTTGMLYGTDLGSYPKGINLMPTLANSVDTLRRTGFGRCVTVGLITEPDVWQEWFNTRFPEPTAEKKARLKEALLSIAWLLQDTSVNWLINYKDEAEKTIQDLLAITRGHAPSGNEQAIAYAEELRSRMTQMLQ